MSLTCVIFSAFSSIYKALAEDPMDTLKVCIPAFVYTIGSALFYVGATYLDAATFVVSYTFLTKIFFSTPREGVASLLDYSPTAIVYNSRI